MSKLSLKDRLVRYMRANHGWVASGELQRIVAQKTTYTPRTAVRRLEELAEEGKLDVQYRKSHAYYRAAQNPMINLPHEAKPVAPHTNEAQEKIFERYWATL